MFNLKKSKAAIKSLTSRVELHGDERKPASDIKLAVDVPAEQLDGISPGLCASLYRQPSHGDQIALIDKKSDRLFTQVRHPTLAPQQLKNKFPGYEIELGQGQDDDYDMAAFFADAEPKNFTITAREGGSSTVEFTVSVGDVSDEDFLALRALQVAGTAIVTLVPPKAQAQQDEQPKAA